MQQTSSFTPVCKLEFVCCRPVENKTERSICPSLIMSSDKILKHPLFQSQNRHFANYPKNSILQNVYGVALKSQRHHFLYSIYLHIYLGPCKAELAQLKTQMWIFPPSIANKG